MVIGVDEPNPTVPPDQRSTLQALHGADPLMSHQRLLYGRFPTFEPVTCCAPVDLVDNDNVNYPQTALGCSAIALGERCQVYSTVVSCLSARRVRLDGALRLSRFCLQVAVAVKRVRPL
jgi:hypothetical protein